MINEMEVYLPMRQSLSKLLRIGTFGARTNSLEKSLYQRSKRIGNGTEKSRMPVFLDRNGNKDHVSRKTRNDCIWWEHTLLRSSFAKDENKAWKCWGSIRYSTASSPITTSLRRSRSDPDTAFNCSKQCTMLGTIPAIPISHASVRPYIYVLTKSDQQRILRPLYSFERRTWSSVCSCSRIRNKTNIDSYFSSTFWMELKKRRTLLIMKGESLFRDS